MQMDAPAPRSDQDLVVDGLETVLDPVTAQARDALLQQARSIAQLSYRLDGRFSRAIRLLFGVGGHVVITGLGKSGHVGRKIAATLASTGTPSFFVHSGEALHGDLGMVTDRDGVILISYSGETREVVDLLPHLRKRGIPTIGLVGKMGSTLARQVDVALDVSVEREVCPNNLAPTSSTLATLAMGDALAVSLMKLRGFQRDDFAQLHPGGSLGRQLSRVGEHTVTEGVAVFDPQTPIKECLLRLATGTLPMGLVCEGSTLHGSVTAEDLWSLSASELDGPIRDAMNEDPPTVSPCELSAGAARRMERESLRALVVVDDDGEVLGLLPRREV